MCICNEQTEAAPRLWANFDPVSSSGGNACLLMQNFLYKIYHNRFNMHLFYCFFLSFFYCLYAKLKSPFSFFEHSGILMPNVCSSGRTPGALAIRNVNISSWHCVFFLGGGVCCFSQGGSHKLNCSSVFHSDQADAPCWMLGSQRGSSLGGLGWVEGLSFES